MSITIEMNTHIIQQQTMKTPQCQSVWNLRFVLDDIVHVECNMTDYYDNAP